MRKFILIFSLFLSASIIISCNSESAENQETALPEAPEKGPRLKPSEVNPNGDSELALLMRDMFTHAEAVKKKIMDGDAELDLRLFEKIHTADPTDQTVRNAKFDAMATAWQASVSAIDEAAPAEHAQKFNLMVDNCMSCHTQFCPGPRMRIKKLYIPKKWVEEQEGA